MTLTNEQYREYRKRYPNGWCEMCGEPFKYAVDDVPPGMGSEERGEFSLGGFTSGEYGRRGEVTIIAHAECGMAQNLEVA